MITVQDGRTSGLDTIVGVRVGIDDRQLVGYPGEEVSPTVTTQASDEWGGCVLSLSDDTRIDHAGIGYVTRGVFA
jgi:hypothetical protein